MRYNTALQNNLVSNQQKIIESNAMMASQVDAALNIDDNRSQAISSLPMPDEKTPKKMHPVVQFSNQHPQILQQNQEIDNEQQTSESLSESDNEKPTSDIMKLDAVNEDEDFDAQEKGTFLIFKLNERLFKFRGDKMPAGQFEWNFTFELPSNAPSSFAYRTATGDSYST